MASMNWVQKQFLKKTVKRQCKLMEKDGYIAIIEDALWEYLLEFRWKKEMPTSRNALKADIQQVTVNEFFDYQRFKVQVMSKEDFSWDDISDLL